MKRTKKITYAALFSALGVVILLLASVMQMADIAVSMLASAIIMLALIELGQSFAIMIYLATSLLSLLFLPHKFIAAVYLAFSGLYPILKRHFDARGKVLSVVFKVIYFNGALVAALLAAKFFFSLEADQGVLAFLDPWVYLGLYFVIANIAFWLFDTVLRRMTLYYMTNLREKTKRFFR